MSTQASRQLILALHDIWNSGSVEQIPEIYGENCTVHRAKGWGPASRGHAQIKDAILHTRSIFPDWIAYSSSPTFGPDLLSYHGRLMHNADSWQRVLA